MNNQFLDRFVSNPNAHGLQQTDGSYIAIREPLTEALFQKHLSKQITLGIYSTNPIDNKSKWLCWDIDTEQEDELSKLTTWLSSYSILLYRESVRPGRSGHVWLFMDQPIYAPDLHRFGTYAKLLVNLQKTEVFPKQDKPLQPDRLGNLVRLPLGIHRKQSANGVIGLFKDCPSQDIQTQLAWFIEQPINKSEVVQKLIDSLPKLPPVLKKKSKQTKDFIPLIERFPPDWPMSTGSGDEIIARCPACAKQGHDNSCTNLWINPVKDTLICHKGCSFKLILEGLKV